MEIKHVNWIYVIRNKSFFQVGVDGNISEEMFKTNEELIGYGIEGYLISSFFAVLNKKDVAFCRRNIKQHGTCSRIDGVLRNKTYTLICLEEDIACAINAINNVVSVVRIVVIKLQNELKNDLTSWDFDAIISKGCKKKDVDLLDYVNLLNDRNYLLSSGKTLGHYYETLPAANTYELIENILLNKKSKFTKYDTFIGVGYGGIFFSVFAAMKFKKRLLVFYDNCYVENISFHEPFQNSNVLVFDDFISTGESVMKAVNGGKFEKYKCIILYAKSNFNINNNVYEICKYIE